MRIGIPSEWRAGETRAAASPRTVTALSDLGYDVDVQSDAGDRSAYAGRARVGQLPQRRLGVPGPLARPSNLRRLRATGRAAGADRLAATLRHVPDGHGPAPAGL